MGDNESTQIMDDPRQVIPKESVPLNHDMRIQSAPGGFFELWLVENIDSRQNSFPVRKLPKIKG